ncbi:MAG TPA: glutamine synthetase family protein [Thermomicrobiaceae bacterium]|nr:glutamine synthetase family protein [Thermomicrobiaceae bacterium]
MGDGLAERLAADGFEHLWVAYTDYHGRLAGRDIPRARFAAVAERGTNFARANFNYTIRDEQVPQPRFGADTGDVLAIPDPDSVVRVPFRPATAFGFGVLHDEAGGVWDGCPRGALLRAAGALAEAGYTARVAFEPEFYLLREDGSTPANTAGMYTIGGLDLQAAFVERVVETLPAMGVSLEAIGKEYGHGQYEANIAPDHPVAAADDLFLLRLAIRHLAREQGLLATFMPKLDATVAGSGLHVHLSLQDAVTGEDRTAGGDLSGLSAPARAFMAGWLAHAEALTGLGAPTPNSYKRLQPGSWAPAHACWGIGNRAALVRIPGPKKRARLEFRCGDNTSSPYLFLAGLIWAGLDGMRRGLDPGAPAPGDVGHLDPAALADRGIRFLPREPGAALDALAADRALAAGLGPVVHPEFLRVKQAELAAYRLQVSPWERTTYLEAP